MSRRACRPLASLCSVVAVTCVAFQAAPASILTFAPADQVAYNALAIFASSANGVGLGTMVINPNDGGLSSNIDFNSQDWFNVAANNALNNLGRVT